MNKHVNLYVQRSMVCVDNEFLRTYPATMHSFVSVLRSYLH